MLAVHNRGLGIEYAGSPGADKVTGDHLGRIGVINLLFHTGMQRDFSHEFIQLVASGRLIECEVQNRHRHIRGGHPNRIASELALKLRQNLRHRLGGTGFGQHHVQCRTTSAPLGFVIVVDQVLVVRISMHCLNVAGGDAILVVRRFQHGHDGIGGTRGC